MKKNGLLSTSLIVLGLTVLSGSQVVLAVGVNEKDAETVGKVTFEANNEPTDPVITPTDPGDTTGNTAALRIDAAPSLDFGKLTLGKGSQSSNNSDANSTLQVTDSRGTLEGWNVTVSRTDFIKTGEAALEATLVLNPGTAKNSSKADVLADSGIVSSSAVTVTATAQPIFSATIGNGGGTHYQAYNGDKARLTVDTNKAKAGLYVAELNWTLTSGIPDTQTSGE